MTPPQQQNVTSPRHYLWVALVGAVCLGQLPLDAATYIGPQVGDLRLCVTYPDGPVCVGTAVSFSACTECLSDGTWGAPTPVRGVTLQITEYPTPAGIQTKVMRPPVGDRPQNCVSDSVVPTAGGTVKVVASSAAGNWSGAVDIVEIKLVQTDTNAPISPTNRMCSNVQADFRNVVYRVDITPSTGYTATTQLTGTAGVTFADTTTTKTAVTNGSALTLLAPADACGSWTLTATCEQTTAACAVSVAEQVFAIELVSPESTISPSGTYATLCAIPSGGGLYWNRPVIVRAKPDTTYYTGYVRAHVGVQWQTGVSASFSGYKDDNSGELSTAVAAAWNATRAVVNVAIPSMPTPIPGVTIDVGAYCTAFASLYPSTTPYTWGSSGAFQAAHVFLGTTLPNAGTVAPYGLPPWHTDAIDKLFYPPYGSVTCADAPPPVDPIPTDTSADSISGAAAFEWVGLAGDPQMATVNLTSSFQDVMAVGSNCVGYVLVASLATDPVPSVRYTFSRNHTGSSMTAKQGKVWNWGFTSPSFELVNIP